VTRVSSFAASLALNPDVATRPQPKDLDWDAPFSNGELAERGIIDLPKIPDVGLTSWGCATGIKQESFVPRNYLNVDR
jgi:hypothetical protein